MTTLGHVWNDKTVPMALTWGAMSAHRIYTSASLQASANLEMRFLSKKKKKKKKKKNYFLFFF